MKIHNRYGLLHGERQGTDQRDLELGVVLNYITI